ncbi:MAG: hypothetical protein U1A07_07795, partial [Phenylobacterium sp.]|nr:hypothetical protein [Phenylobacterium sp.]
MRLTAFRPLRGQTALAAMAVLALSLPAHALGQADPFGALYTPAPLTEVAPVRPGQPRPARHDAGQCAAPACGGA